MVVRTIPGAERYIGTICTIISGPKRWLGHDMWESSVPGEPGSGYEHIWGNAGSFAPIDEDLEKEAIVEALTDIV